MRPRGPSIGRTSGNPEVAYDPASGRTWRLTVNLEADLGSYVKPLVDERPISASGVANKALRMIFEDPELRDRFLGLMPKPDGPEQLQIGERKAS